MRNLDAGKLIKAADSQKRKGRGRFNDRKGEVRMMCCGLTAEIIEYRSHRDMDIQFEDGAIVTNRPYDLFLRGYIKHPDKEKSCKNKERQLLRDKHIGETKIMNNGLRATIIDYNGRYDVDIQFEDDVVIKGICYSSWVKGESTHPTVKTQRKQRVPEEKIKGMVNMMSNGMQATIIAARSVCDIDVEFEDGSIAKNKALSSFKTGNICHPSKKQGRKGETRMMNNGMQATIIAYRSSRDVDIRFEDNTVVLNKDYHAFEKGNVRNPNLVNKKENRKNNKKAQP